MTSEEASARRVSRLAVFCYGDPLLGSAFGNLALVKWAGFQLTNQKRDSFLLIGHHMSKIFERRIFEHTLETAVSARG